MKAFRETMSWIVPIVIGLLIALLIKQFVFQIVRVDGPSMEPNLVNNERVFCLKTAKIHHGSVVIFDANGVDPQVAQKTDYVKRVIGLPGDKVRSDNGNIMLMVRRSTKATSVWTNERRELVTGRWRVCPFKIAGWSIMEQPRYQRASTLFLGTTGVFQMMVVTGALYQRVRLMG